MTDLLIRLFLSGGEDIHDPEVRRRYGQLSGSVGIFLNLLLFAGKFLAGLLTGSIAVTADAFNNLSDVGSSVMTLVGFRLAGQKADQAHPFGHGRMEYLTGLMVSLLILLVGFEIGKSAVVKLFHPEEISFSVLSVVILGCSIAVKLWLCLFNRRLAKRIGSTAMAATATDSLSDMAATAAVLLSTLAEHYAGIRIDAWAGILVAGFILRSGWGAAKDTLDPLLGQCPSPELVREIEETVLAHPELLGMHDLVIHDYGPGRSMMSFHVEVPVDGDIMALHDVVDGVERQLKDKFQIAASVHMDPIVTNDALTNRTRVRVAALVRGINPDITIHDFRMTAGPLHTNLIFDVLIPFGCPLPDEQVEKNVKSAVEGMEPGKFFAVIELDHAFIPPL